MQTGISYQIKPGCLILRATPQARRELQQQFPDGECTDAQLAEVLEDITCNSELEWVDPLITGDLTGAPMLGIYGKEQPGGAGREVGCWPDADGVLQKWSQPVLHRWAYMNYQVRCLVGDLIDYGEAILVGE